MALGDQFDEVLTVMISNLTEQLQECANSGDRSRAVISGKRDMMQLLVEKTLEYFRAVDPQAEMVLTDLATQYESLIDQALSMANGDNPTEANSSNAPNSGSDKLQKKQLENKLKEKDREVKRLKD